MAGGVNKVILVGNLGRDPVIRSTTNGASVASFPLATSDSWIDKNTKERKEKTEWHNIVVFGSGLIDIIERNVRKGTKLYVEGTLQTRRWTDSAGIERAMTEVVLQGFNCTLSILDKKTDKAEEGGSENSYSDTIDKKKESADNQSFESEEESYNDSVSAKDKVKSQEDNEINKTPL